MNDETAVRKRYPQATLSWNKPVGEMGQATTYEPGYWAVYPADGLGYQEIGRGDTADAAWRKAASVVAKEQRSADAQAWLDWLLANGYQWSKEDRHSVVHPNDSKLAATISPTSGQFLATPELSEELAEVMVEGKPPKV